MTADRSSRPYQLRYTYDPSETVAGAAIHSRHEHIDDAAEAFIHLTAPFKQVVVDERGELEYLDDLEEARLQSIVERSGYEVEDIDGAAQGL